MTPGAPPTLSRGLVMPPVRGALEQHTPAAFIRCDKPVIGPLVTLVRKLVWRATGLEHAFTERHREMARTLSRLEVLRLLPYLRFRPGTLDWRAFDEVVFGNEYGLPEMFGPQDVVLDVGMHIGSFSFAALLRGAGTVYGFEPEKENFALACHNLRLFPGRTRLRNQAVWRSDRTGDRLFHEGSAAENTAGGSVLWATSGQEVDVAAFDDVVREATEGGRRRVRLVKLDCEGSEFPVLLTSRTLHLIDEIRGEYHEINDGTYNTQPVSPSARVEGVERFSVGVLAGCLERAGFTVTTRRAGSTSLGWFVATRT